MHRSVMRKRKRYADSLHATGRESVRGTTGPTCVARYICQPRTLTLLTRSRGSMLGNFRLCELEKHRIAIIELQFSHSLRFWAFPTMRSWVPKCKLFWIIFGHGISDEHNQQGGLPGPIRVATWQISNAEKVQLCLLCNSCLWSSHFGTTVAIWLKFNYCLIFERQVEALKYFLTSSDIR